MQDIIHSLWIGLACLGALGAVLTLLLRAARIPGGTPAAAIAAGIISGILLGATVLGKSNPELYEHWFVGGVEEQAALSEAQLQLERDIAAMRTADVSEEAIAEHYRTLQVNINDLEELHESSLSSHAKQLKNVMLLVLAAYLLIPMFISRGPTLAKSSPRVLLPLVFVVVASGIPSALLVMALGYGSPSALLAGMCASFGAGWFWLDQGLEIRDPNKSSIRNNWTIIPSWLIAVGCVPVSAMELSNNSQFWLALIGLAIITHDGRWLAYLWIIKRLGNEDQRANRWTISGTALSSDAALWQAAFAGVLFTGELNTDPEIVAALILSALIIELCQPIRQPVARWMDEQFSQPKPTD
ncbi:MAG: hypothetical protein ACYTF7_05425 [Planctomycetota bacterium]|jgi:hypothetical protein